MATVGLLGLLDFVRLVLFLQIEFELQIGLAHAKMLKKHSSRWSIGRTPGDF